MLLNPQNLANALTGAQDRNHQQTRRSRRRRRTSRACRRWRERVLARVGVPRSPRSSSSRDSSVSMKSNADILDFNVTNHDPTLARKLADSYAGAYTIYRRQLDTAPAKARADQRRPPHGAARTCGRPEVRALHEPVRARAAARRDGGALVVAGDASSSRPTASQVQPKPTRNGILGLALGIILGIGLAFLWEALDTRVRSAQEIGEKLGGLPLLARVAAPSKKLRAENHLVMLDDPTGVQAETFRMLRTNLDFVTLDRDVRTIMVTSAVEQEGKSTTIANLAVALARAGQRVVLVDLDLRRPFLDKFFDLNGPGITQVALGHASLDDALARVAIADPDARQARRRRDANGNGNGNGNGLSKSVKGVLEVLPIGPDPARPGRVRRPAGAERDPRAAARARRHRPDRLAAGAARRRRDDAEHEGRRDRARHSDEGRPPADARRARAAARHVPTPVLGFVVTGAGEEEGYGYGYGYGYGHGRHARPYEQSEKPARARSET